MWKVSIGLRHQDNDEALVGPNRRPVNTPPRRSPRVQSSLTINSINTVVLVHQVCQSLMTDDSDDDDDGGEDDDNDDDDDDDRDDGVASSVREEE